MSGRPTLSEYLDLVRLEAEAAGDAAADELEFALALLRDRREQRERLAQTRAMVERVLAKHPKQREFVEAGAEESRQEREHCECVMREISGFLARGIPSRFGLIVSLGALLEHLRDIRADMDEQTARRWRELGWSK